MNRSAKRELVFKLVYSMEIQKSFDNETIETFLEDKNITNPENKKYIYEIVNGIIENKEEIKEKISNNLKKDWTIDRISKIELTLLEISIFEILYYKIPFKVSINEAVELAKKYAESQSPSFINGVLANIVKELN